MCMGSVNFMRMHGCRAERFGADYVEPGKVRKELALEAKRERLSRPAFVTGFDPFSQVRGGR